MKGIDGGNVQVKENLSGRLGIYFGYEVLLKKSYASSAFLPKTLYLA